MNKSDKKNRETLEDRILTIPNVISIFRIFLSPIVLIALVREELLIAFVIGGIAALSDWMDGFFARKYGETSKIGIILDPLADRLMVMFFVVGMYSANLIETWLLLGFVLREIIAILGFLYFKDKGIQLEVTKTGKVIAGIVYSGLLVFVIVSEARIFAPVLIAVYFYPLIGYYIQAKTFLKKVKGKNREVGNEKT